MLKIDGLSLPLGSDIPALIHKAAHALRLKDADILSLKVLRKSIDAREEVLAVYSVEVAVKDERPVLRQKNPQVSRGFGGAYTPPAALTAAPEIRPIVVGAGPGGLFCALLLAEAGAKPILLERGQPVEERQKDVEEFWKSGVLNPRSNVQFGEGGAGTFSDGKLNTGTKDLRHSYILQQFVAFGAPDTILVDAKPHIGTDKLQLLLPVLRAHLLALGCDIRFGHQLVELKTTDGALSGAVVEHEGARYTLPARQLVLAPGHSARDSFQMLFDAGIALEQKPFAVGVRMEHLQAEMDGAQYKKFAGHPLLPASTYKLSCHLESGRSVYSFCVCPGGEVVAGASEEGRLVTNGMSPYARSGKNINGGLLVNITPEDFGGASPLAGIALQRKLEEAAFTLGGGNFHAPAQLVGDFLAGVPSTQAGRVQPSYRPGVRFTDLRLCLPDFVADAIAEALPLFDKKVKGYAAPDAVMTGVETRSSSPVRILRGENAQSVSLRGLYPCGEGAGYAGGILSAAADGMKCAERILEELR